MLGNNEIIQGVDKTAVFTQMLREVPWSSLKMYVQANAPLLKVCTIGGHRLEPNKRDRIEKIILRELERPNMTEALTNGIFASWYPVHEHLHKQLEDHFHSEDYKAWRKEENLGEDDYVLTDAKFDEFFLRKDFAAWRILLCFSPLKFTHEQADKILNDSEGSAELMDRFKEVEAEKNDLQKKVDQLNAEAERLRAKQQADASEIQDLKRQLRQNKVSLDQSRSNHEAAVSEMRRANQTAAQFRSEAEAREEAIREEMNRVVMRLQGDNERLTKELASWQSRYEDQCNNNTALVEKAAEAEKRSAEALESKKKSDSIAAECQQFADLILSRIDWPRVGAAMKMTPTVRRNFNSLVRKLSFDENNTLTLEETLPVFWNTLKKTEHDLVEAIAESSTREMMDGDADEFWMGIKESFDDVQVSLEARLAMLGILHDIFFQNMENEDLEKTTGLPISKPKKK
ncbi:MAG: hypothetical protein GX937_11280 [Lentisphaerae bacterium]|jgi:hypothetical protein|nr:hypothetical protein [Lentisphaerota bacterium]